MKYEPESDFLRRYFYVTREIVGAILVDGVPENREAFLKSITDMIDKYENYYLSSHR